jgi:hypothetical protein
LPLPLPFPLPPLLASETAAKATAVIPAASSERPSGPTRIVIALLFFITTPSSVDSRHRGLDGHEASRA